MLDNGVVPEAKDDSLRLRDVDLILGSTPDAIQGVHFAIVRKVDEFTVGIAKISLVEWNWFSKTLFDLWLGSTCDYLISKF